jgi:hypothetical protein
MKTEVTIYKFLVALLGFASMVVASPIVPHAYIGYVAEGVSALTALLVYLAPYVKQPKPPTTTKHAADSTVTELPAP